MKLLIDTHVLIWWLTAPERIDAGTLAALDDPSNRVLVSVASIWEIAIKAGTGRLPFPDRMMEILARNRVTILPIKDAHALAVANLPPLHKDPFDRMLVAQAMHEGLTLVTRDPWILAYPAATMRA